MSRSLLLLCRAFAPERVPRSRYVGRRCLRWLYATGTTGPPWHRSFFMRFFQANPSQVGTTAPYLARGGSPRLGPLACSGLSQKVPAAARRSGAYATRNSGRTCGTRPRDARRRAERHGLDECADATAQSRLTFTKTKPGITLCFDVISRKATAITAPVRSFAAKRPARRRMMNRVAQSQRPNVAPSRRCGRTSPRGLRTEAYPP